MKLKESRHTEDHRDAEGMPIALTELRLREILVPTDFTECSLKALSYALSSKTSKPAHFRLLNHFSYHNRKVFDLMFVRRASQNDVGPSGLGRHEEFVHRGYRLSKLPMNGAHIAASCGSVSLYASVKAEPGRTIKKDAKIEHAANFRPPQKPKAVHQDNWFGRQYSGLTHTRVSDKVVFWRLHLAA
jgi:hypothetical protein